MYIEQSNFGPKSYLTSMQPGKFGEVINHFVYQDKFNLLEDMAKQQGFNTSPSRAFIYFPGDNFFSLATEIQPSPENSASQNFPLIQIPQTKCVTASQTAALLNLDMPDIHKQCREFLKSRKLEYYAVLEEFWGLKANPAAGPSEITMSAYYLIRG